MQTSLRRFFLIGVILLALLTATGWFFWYTKHKETALNFTKGMAHYHQQEYAEAAQWFRKAAEHAHAQAQYQLAHLYDSGAGVTEDNPQAVQWYRQAAAQGYAPAQLHLGSVYERGAGVPQDQSAALKWFRQAAEQGYAPAQDLLGMMYQLEVGVTQDEQQAVAWYRKAAEQGHAKAQYHLGQSYYKGQGVTKDEQEAIKWLRKAAAQGQPDAQAHALAIHFEVTTPSDSGHQGDNDGPTKMVHNMPEPASQTTQVPTIPRTTDDVATQQANPQKTFQQYRRAAEQGDAQAQFQVGVMYDRGTGVAQDEQQALKWIRKAAAQGLAPAQDYLGMIYYKSVTLDDQQAVNWFRQAAEQGFAPAQLHLGLMYQLGDGVIEDDQQAMNWFRKAADQGDVSAQTLLAVLSGEATVNPQPTAPMHRNAPNLQPQRNPKPVITHPQAGIPNPNSHRGGADQRVESNCPNNQYELTVNATPSTSRIRIMNIRPKYQPGICLAPQRYDIYVTHQGYHNYRKWITLDAADAFVEVTLTPK